ncbi:probable 2' cyclic ADP-D-ribose synthase BdTIR [Nicotiana tomentosiformis]|uniref:probable 2' cyclic ADP-D-ribose synthase BdTIR n=1 Tax=Nicotiana tomentosiformis TaxID=4098 RepID=UPI00051C7A52|nr:TMV resistance protein N-like [Nicotiana tomentosiformis]
MQRALVGNLLQREIQISRNQITKKVIRSQLPCEVFINHRGNDTKRTISSLLYDHLTRLRIRSFLDNKNMKPGDKLFEKIDSAIKECKVGIAVFSPRYCDSYFCLHELALFVESKKKVIPIFCDVKPSELRAVNKANLPLRPEEIVRFNLALEEAKLTVGLDFDSNKGNWSDVVTKAADVVIESLIEIEDEQTRNQATHIVF